MKILWFTWKDRTHPQSGGAEVVNEELAQRLVRDGHEVIFVVGGYEGCVADEVMPQGFRVVRLGNRYTVYWRAYQYYHKNLRNWADVIIEEINTIPFFTQWYTTERRILFFHQLCREIWFYQMSWWIGWIGWLVEPVYLWLLRKNRTITISQSTKRDLMKYGFAQNNIHIIAQGMNLDAVDDLRTIDKYDQPTVLSLGAVRKMKNTLDQVRAFEIAKEKMPNLRMIVAGDASDAYGQFVCKAIAQSPHEESIDFLGRVSEEKKTEIMRRSHVILVTSVKEGWGLIVSEAASQGTPAIVYDVDGLRDSVLDGEGGYITQENTPYDIAQIIEEIFRHTERYAKIQETAWNFAQKMDFEKSYQDFWKIVGGREK